MGILISLLLLVIAWLAAKMIFASGFVAGKDHEARLWIKAIDALFVPNWQSLPIQSDEVKLDPDKLKMANQVFVAAYTLALDRIKKDIVEIRQEQLIKSLAENEEEPRYPAV